MPSYRDIVYGIYGALRLARLDAGAMSYFERTPAGFWKSFFAAVIVAPGFAIIIAYEFAQIEIEAGALRVFMVETLAYVLGWAVFPVLVHQICEVIGKRAAYIGYIVAFNWSKVVQMVVFLPCIGLIALGALPGDSGSLLLLAVTLLILGYEWFITRTALAVTAMGAAGFVVLDLVIDLVIRRITIGMLQ
ncbi:MAG: hypothetical protein ACTSQ7_06825 [Alphaproteobacteria bacterium]